MTHLLLILLLTLALFALPGCTQAASPTAQANGIAVVDTVRLFSESAPAKAAVEHMAKVQSVLQQGLEQLQGTFKNTDTPEAQQAIAQGYNALQQQMALEQQAVNEMLNRLALEAVHVWRSSSKATIVISRQTLLGMDEKADVTSEVMQEMNKLKPVFSALPTVQVNPPEPEPEPAAPAKKPEPKSRRK